MIWGTLGPMKARLIYRIREAYGAGIIEAVIWEVPEPVRPSEHRVKYRLAYIVGGKRIIGYDNERGKGDHRHVWNTEHRYRFTDVETLLADFLQDIGEIES